MFSEIEQGSYNRYSSYCRTLCAMLHRSRPMPWIGRQVCFTTKQAKVMRSTLPGCMVYYRDRSRLQVRKEHTRV